MPLMYRDTKPKYQQFDAKNYLTYGEWHEKILKLKENLKLNRVDAEVLLATLEYNYFLNKSDGLLIRKDNKIQGAIKAIRNKIRWRYSSPNVSFNKEALKQSYSRLYEKGYIIEAETKEFVPGYGSTIKDPENWKILVATINFRVIAAESEGVLF